MTTLSRLVADELAEPVDPRVTAMAAAIAAEFPGSARAVLFYGSCLRSAEFDGQMLDFYVIVADYRRAYRSRFLAIANRLVPPNVFPFAHDGLTAKYAVLSEADFHRLNGPETLNPSVWARFAQPSRLVWAAGDAAREAAIAAIARAAPTLLASAPDGPDRWRAAFALTYGAELRAERAARPGAVVDADPDRYARFTAPALAEAPAHIGRNWPLRRVQGKTLTVLRLAKASLTFAGGIDYLAWKVSRHSGADIIIRPWMRRWPLVGAITLLPRLLGSGAIR